MAVPIGLKKGYYAILTSDIEGAAVYSAPVALEKMQQVQVNPKVNKVQVAADDIIDEEFTQCLGADITMQRKMFTLEEEAILLGHPVDSNGGVYEGTDDNPPYVAFGYERTLSDGSGIFVWILKTKFAPSNSTADTKPVDNISPQYSAMSISSITRRADRQWKYSRQSSDPNFADTFFTQATLQALSSGITHDAIALSSSDPIDGETDVSKTDPITLTFNNKIASEAVSIIEADGTLVSVTKTFDSTGKILTITPASALTGTTVYIVAVNGVTDIYGQTLAASAIDFTTIA